MNIVVSGLNHNSAAIDIREKLAFSAADTIKALKELGVDLEEAAKQAQAAAGQAADVPKPEQPIEDML